MSQKDVTHETIVKKEATIQPTSCAIMQEVRALKAPVEQSEHTLEHESAILDKGRALFWRFGVITPIGHSSSQGVKAARAYCWSQRVIVMGMGMQVVNNVVKS